MEVNWPNCFEAETPRLYRPPPIEETNQWKADTAAEWVGVAVKIDTILLASLASFSCAGPIFVGRRDGRRDHAAACSDLTAGFEE